MYEIVLVDVYFRKNGRDRSNVSRSKILTIVRATACVNAFTTNVSELYATVWLGAVLQEVDHRSSSRNSVMYSSRYLDHRYYVSRGVRKKGRGFSRATVIKPRDENEGVREGARDEKITAYSL